MKKLQPNTLPLVSPPESLEKTEIIDDNIEKTVKPQATQAEIASASREGRLTIRSGEVAPQILNSLAAKFGPDYIVAKFEECLMATKTMAISGRPFETVDYKTRLDALKALMQYQVGMPVARSEVITHNVDTMQTLESKMQTSPALRRAIGRMLDKSKSESGDLIDVSENPESPLTEQEISDAEDALQYVPSNQETPIQAEVRKRSMMEELKSRGNMSVIEKFSR